MSIFDNPVERLEAWKNNGHDDECEQRERSYICHCAKRRRLATGLTEVPTDDLYFPPPTCTHCHGDLEYDGDLWECPKCHIVWDRSGEASTARFVDDYGTDFGGEQFGHLMRHMAAAS